MANSFQQGFNAVQKGGKWGPDAVEKKIKGAFTGDGKDNKDLKAKASQPGTQMFKSEKNGDIFLWDAENQYWINMQGTKKIRKDAGIRLFNKAKVKKPAGETFKEDQAMAKKQMGEGLGDMAHMAEKDHEVQMARAQLYKVAKYAIKLHDILKNVSEADGLEGWVQSKITKSSDYISSVYHHLDYEQASGEINDNEVSVEVPEGKSPHKKGTKKYKKHMAAMHAESADNPYKSHLRAKLAEKKK